MDGEDYTLSFEAVKTSFRQTKDGYHLTLVIHPNDVPEELFSSWVGTRYQCAIVELSDENEPVKRVASREADAVVQQAGMLCRSNRFQSWILEFTGATGDDANEWGDNDEEFAARLLRQVCNINSRKELRNNPEAQKTLGEVFKAFKESIDQGGTPW